jgi:hypothetical protein
MKRTVKRRTTEDFEIYLFSGSQRKYLKIFDILRRIKKYLTPTKQKWKGIRRKE